MRKSFVLSIILWFIFIFMAAGIYFLSMIKDINYVNKGINSKLIAEINANNLLEQIKYYLATGESFGFYIHNDLINFPSKIFIDNRKFGINKCIVQIQDANGLINILFPNYQTLQQMFSNTNSLIKINSLKDWYDKDSIQRIYGAEINYYISHGFDYGPRNSNYINFIDELRNIRGWNDYNLTYIEKNFVYYTSSGRYNYATMPLKILKIRYKLTSSDIKKLSIYRKQGNLSLFNNYFLLHKKKFDIYNDTIFPGPVYKIKILCTNRLAKHLLYEVINIKKNIVYYSR